MKKQVLAIVLSIVMASGSIGSVPAFAAEPDNQEASIEIEQIAEETASGAETAEETAQTAEEEAGMTEASSDSIDTVQDEQTQIPSEASTEAVTTEVAAEEEPDVEDAAQETTADDPAVVPEETVVSKDALNGNEVLLEEEPQYCGDNVTWTLTCRGDEQVGPFTLTISGNGEMYDYSDDSINPLISSVGRPGTEINSAPPWYTACFYIDTIIVEEGVTYIGKNAFSDTTSLTSVSLPDSLTGLGQNAFKGSGIVSLTLPSAITEIGDGAFNRCEALEDISIPEGVTMIPDGMFLECTALSSISLHENISSIGAFAFSECESLSSISLPDNLTEIGFHAFSGCFSLSEVEMPDNLTTIDDYAFAGCSSLANITIPNGVTTIGGAAFGGCSSLTEIILSDNLTEINDYAFSDCSSLTEITIPNSVSIIRESVFQGCSALTEVTLPDNLTEMERFAFSGCSSLTGITIPDSVSIIRESTFLGCSALTEVTLPDYLTEIERFAFSGCSSLTSVEFPFDLGIIGSKAFQDCTSLEEITVPGKYTETSNDSFYNDEQLIKCYTIHGAYIADHVPTYDGKNSVTTIIYMDDVEYGVLAFYLDRIYMSVGDEVRIFDYLNNWRPNNSEGSWPILRISNEEDFSYDDANDILTGHRAGETNVTVTWGGQTAAMKVICVDEDVPIAEGVAFKYPEITVVEGQYFFNPLVLTPEISKKDFDTVSDFPFCLFPEGCYLIPSDVGIVSDYGECFLASKVGTTTVSLEVGRERTVIAEFVVTVVEPSCGLQVQETDIEIEKGTTKKLRVTKSPVSNTDPITFESSNSSVAEVSETGVITAKGYGFATVTVSCGNVSIDVSVKVPCPATGISLPDAIQIRYGEEIRLAAVLEPSYTTDRDVEWTIEGEEIFSLWPFQGNCCSISGYDLGTATLTATINGHTASTEVTVIKGIPDFDKVDPIEAKCGQTLSELELPYNMEWQDPDQSVGSAGEHTFAATYVPDYPEFYETVDDIMVVVNVSHDFAEDWTSSDGTHWHKCSCGEIVNDNGDGWVSVSSISLNKDEMTLYTGMDDLLLATVLPGDASEKGVIWTTSDENVVTVDEYGTVFAVGAGDAVITATTVDGTRDAVNTSADGANGLLFAVPNADGGLIAQCTVHVLREPEIVQDPSDVEALVGETVEFTVVAEGNGLTYQWQWSSDGSTWKNCTGTGYNSDTFSFVMKEKFAGRWYRCRVSTSDRRLVSEPALLSLKESDEIIAHPDDVDAEEGDTVAFIVEFSGDHPTYQWQWSSDGTVWRNCTGPSYNTDTFTFVMHAKYAGRMYRCKVTEDGETYISEAALLNLIQVSEILSQPDDAEAAAGETVAFIVEFSGQNPKYQWQKSTDGGATWKNCTGAGYNSSIFSFAMEERFAGRMYRCVITDGDETYISDSALLSLSTDVRITKQPEDVTVKAGQTAVFHVEASGNDLTYQWQCSSNGSTWKNCTSSGYKTDTFSFRAQKSYSGRLYRCRVTSGSDKVYSDPGLLTVTN